VHNDRCLRTARGGICALRTPPYLVVAVAIGTLLGCRSPNEQHGDRKGPRIVCLTPSSTEVVAAVAGVDAIVGVDKYSDYPEPVKQLPKVGDFVSPHFEAILRLQPDLVVMDEDQAPLIEKSLREAHIRTLALRMETASDVTDGLAKVGEALSLQDQAEREIARVEAELAQVRELARKARGGGPPRRVLFVVDRELGGLGNMVAAGPDTYINEMIALAGGENVIDDSPVRFPRISAELVLTRAPDVILDAVHTKAVQRAASDWNALSSVPAVANGRVHVLGDTMHTHPSPRLGLTLRRIVELIYGV